MHVLLVSHGKLAEGLLDTLSLFAKENIKDVLSIGLKDGESQEDFKKRAKKILSILSKDEKFIILADIVGGSPLTNISSMLYEEGLIDRAVILGGMNLALALTTLLLKDQIEPKELTEKVLSDGKASIQELVLNNSDNEDDDL